MSNLVRQYYVTNDSTPKRVVNKNNKFEAKIREIEELRIQQQKIQRILGKELPEFTEQPLQDFGSDDGFVQGIDVLQVATSEGQAEELIQAQALAQQETEMTSEASEALLINARQQADDIVAEAEEKARIILEEAKAQAEALYEEKKKQGYEEGSNDKLEEIMRMKEEIQTQIDSERERLEEEFSQKSDEMEKDIVEAMIEVFDRVFHIQFDNKKELLLHLIKNTLMNVEVGREFRIHVAQNNYKFLLAHLDDVRERVGNDVEIEIVNDANLETSDCQIETSYGIFDCGIDMELSNLVKDIRSLCG